MTAETSASQRAVNQSQVRRTSNDEEIISLSEIIGVMLDRKWFIAIFLVVCTVFGVAYALLATPVYQATALIQVEDSKPSVPGLDDMTSLFEGSSETVTEIELLKSRTVIGGAVGRLKLYTVAEPKLFPIIGSRAFRKFTSESKNDLAAPLFGASSYAWGGERIDIFKFSVPKGYLGKKFELVVGDNNNIKLLNPNGDMVIQGKVGEDLSQGFYQLTVRSLNARPGTHFTLVRNNRLSTILKLQSEINASEKGKKSGIINLSYENKDAEFAKLVLNTVANIYVRQNVEQNSAEAQQSLDFLQTQLPQIKKQLEAAEQRLNDYQVNQKSIDISLETQGILEQLVELETKLQELNLKRLELARKFKHNHPIYQGILEQIASVKKQRDELADKVSNLPETQQELLRLTRDVKVNNEIYFLLLTKAQELDIVRAGTVGNVRIVDTADVDTSKPVKPIKSTIVGVAFLLGLIIPIGIVFLQRSMHNGVENPDDIEELGLPVYACIPKSKEQSLMDVRYNKVKTNKHRLLAEENPADLAVEALRSLRTSIHFAMMEAKNNVVTISGPAPSVGKSFVSTNFATVLAKTGQKILVIDADLRKGHLQRLFAVKVENGLSDYLAGKSNKEEVIKPTSIEGLDIITRGQIPPNPSELLMHPRFKALLDVLEKQYDMIIIDTPPILAVTDASIIATHAGTTLMVGRFGQNTVKEIEVARHRFAQTGIDVKGFILNAVEKKASNYGYGYGYYNYEYKSDK